MNPEVIFNERNDAQNVKIPRKLEQIIFYKKLHHFRIWCIVIVVLPILFFISRNIRDPDFFGVTSKTTYSVFFIITLTMLILSFVKSIEMVRYIILAL